MDILESMERMFNDYYIKYGELVTVDNNKGIKAIFKEIEDSKNSNDNKYIIVPKDIIGQGSIINTLDSKWLVIEKPQGYYKNYDKAVMRKTEPINFVFNKKVHNVPCVIDTKVMDLETGQDLTLPNGTIQITMQNNNITKQLIIGQRFLKSNYIEANAWKIEGIDSISSEGLLILTCSKDEINPAKDDTVNQIADFRLNIEHNYTIEIRNGDVINMSLADKLQLEVIVKDNGQVLESPTITYKKDTASIIDLSSTGYIIAINVGDSTVTAEYEGVKANVKIIVTRSLSVDDSYTLELQGKDKATISGKYNVTAIVRNNGLEVNNIPVNFTVNNVDSYSKDLATIIITENNICNLQINKDTNTIGKSFSIRAVLSKDGKEITAEKKVKIASIFG